MTKTEIPFTYLSFYICDSNSPASCTLKFAIERCWNQNTCTA